jgi:hypothetical protein
MNRMSWVERPDKERPFINDRDSQGLWFEAKVFVSEK